MVIGFHFSIPGFSMGFLGVDVFFVLSGFLITSILIRDWGATNHISLPRFYLRRALRLFPALLALLLLLSLLRLEPWLHIAATLFYAANWATALDWLPLLQKGYLLHAWSLAIEEQFYLLWPAVIALIFASRVPRKILFLVPLSLAVASAFMRTFMYQSGAWIQRIYRGTDTHADGLFIGCTLGMILAFNGKLSKRSLVLISLLAFPYTIAVLFRLIPSDTIYQGGYTLVGLAVMVIVYFIAVSANTARRKALPMRLLEYVGRISYGLYLWHVPVYLLLLREVGIRNPQLRWLSLLFTLMVASLSFFVIELPFLRLKDRLTTAKGSSLLVDQVEETSFASAPSESRSP
jgi:peptidoglycan/LPS O-acetylase OafA/YrhL